jgi:shikimate kinase
MTAPALVLVGPPGSGKTTVGRAVAVRLGVPFRDTDDDVVAAAGRTVAELFVDEGEAAFRARERVAVVAALAEHAGVLALGGGAVLDPRTQADLRGQRVAFLDVGMADAVSRIGLNRDRPLLVGNVRAQIKRLLDERRHTYLALATHTVVTDGRSADEVADELAALCRVDPR